MARSEPLTWVGRRGSRPTIRAALLDLRNRGDQLGVACYTYFEDDGEHLVTWYPDGEVVPVAFFTGKQS